MNAGDEKDQYVDFFLGAILIKVQMQLTNGNKDPWLQFYLQWRNFFKLHQNNPMRSSCLISLDLTVSIASFKRLVSFMNTKAAPV